MCVIPGTEAPGSRGARREHAGPHVTDEQRREAGCPGGQNRAVISGRSSGGKHTIEHARTGRARGGVSDRLPARGRRHGRGVSGARSAARPRHRTQGDPAIARRTGRRARSPAARGDAGLGAEPPQHRHHPRHRHRRRRSLHRDGAGGGPHAARPVARRSRVRACHQHRQAGGRGAGGRPCRPDRPSRHQAGQRHGAPRRLREAARLRPRAAARRGGPDRTDGPGHRSGHDHRHDRLHVARTGAWRPGGAGGRHLRVWRHALRAGHGAASVHGGVAARHAARAHVGDAGAAVAAQPGGAARARAADRRDDAEGSAPAAGRRRSAVPPERRLRLHRRAHAVIRVRHAARRRPRARRGRTGHRDGRPAARVPSGRGAARGA